MKLSGIGHQLKKDEKAFESCKGYLELAAQDISKIDNLDAERLFNMINVCITQATSLSYSANEAFNQND